MRKIIFVTGNAHKVKEAGHILSPLGITVEQNNCGYPELQEDELEKIAAYGAEWAANKLGSEISRVGRGDAGFGYDPIFAVGKRTFGEMGEEEKNKLSHRYRVLLKFAEWLNEGHCREKYLN
jgi:inosine/xanthosine triphosphate pyrophosphatase family protein